MTMQTRFDAWHTKPNVMDLYTDAGMTIVPCAGFGKAFQQKGLINAEFNANYRVRVDCNHKVLLRNCYIVVDVDPRNFSPVDDRPLRRLLSDLKLDDKRFKDTFTVRSPGGGFHFYFKKHPSVQIRQSLSEYPGIDFLSSSITAAGSFNPEQDKNYEIIHKSPMEISACPDVLLALLTRPKDIDVVAEGLLNDHPVNIKKFIEFLSNTDVARNGQGGDRRTFQVAAFGKDLAITADKCHELMRQHFNPRCEPPWEDEKLLEKIKNAYEYGFKLPGSASIENDFKDVEQSEGVKKIVWQVDSTGTHKKNLANTIQWLQGLSSSILRDTLRFNLFSSRIEFIKDPPWYKKAKDWSDEDAIQCKAYLSVNKFFDVSVQMIHEAAVVIASQKSYHPVRDYIAGLRWDGLPRIHNWLTNYCGAKETEYSRFVGRKTLIGAVSRVFKPGCKFDHCLVLVGDQGTGKSLLCRILSEPWFTDAALDIHSKDAVEILQGNWIVELSEMDVLTKAESRSLKAFITRQTDRLRPAYARNAEPFDRQCIFMGTINPEAEGFLKDSTGNRRWWPVRVERINLSLLKAERDQLWAEAYFHLKKGENCHVTDDAMRRLIAKETDQYQQEDPWTSMVADWLDRHEFDFYDEKRFEVRIQVSDVYQQCLGGNKIMLNMREAIRIATILKSLGYAKTAGNINQTHYIKHISNIL
jgi:predicted P-loop ATPase